MALSERLKRGLAAASFVLPLFAYISIAWVNASSIGAQLADGPVSSLFDILKIIMIVSLAVRLFLLDVEWAAIITHASAIAFGCIVWFTSGEGWPFWAILFLLSSRNISFRLISKTYFWATLAVLVLVESSVATGLIVNESITSPSGAIRYGMGFDHPNAFSALLLTHAMSVMSLLPHKRKTPALLIAICTGTVIMLTSRSRTVLVALVLAALLYCLMVVVDKQETKKFVVESMGAISILAIIGSIILMIVFDDRSDLLVGLDDLLSGRICLSHFYLEIHAPGLLGFNFDSMAPVMTPIGQVSSFLVDNSYARLLLRYGLLATFFASAVIVYFWHREAKALHWNFAIFGLFVFLIFGLSETYALAIESNLFLFVFIAGTEPAEERKPTLY